MKPVYIAVAVGLAVLGLGGGGYYYYSKHKSEESPGQTDKSAKSADNEPKD